MNRLFSVIQVDIPSPDKYLGLLRANTLTSFEICIADFLINDIKENKKHRDTFLKSNLYRRSQREERYRLIEYYDKFGDKISDHVYGITFSNVKSLKKYFLEILGCNEPNSLEDLDEFYILRNDIMHRNGKTKQGVTIKVTEQSLRDCINCVSRTISNIQKLIYELNTKNSKITNINLNF